MLDLSLSLFWLPHSQLCDTAGALRNDRLCSDFPPQALEDRGIVELLLTSDNKDGLSKGVVHGGTCTGAVGALSWMCMLPLTASATGGVARKSVLLPFSWRWAPKLWASEC